MHLTSLIVTVVLASVSVTCTSQELHQVIFPPSKLRDSCYFNSYTCNVQSARRLQAENVGRLEENAELTRAALRDNPTDSRLYAQLGTLLHHLDFISPNGGARIPEAEQAYL